MSYTVKIRFHGTVAVVRQDDRVTLLLPRFDALGDVIPLTAYLRFPKAWYDGANTRETLPPPPGKEHWADFRHVVLNEQSNNGELLKITADEFGDDSQQFLADFHTLGFDIPFPEDNESLHWIPTLDRLTPEANPRIDPALLGLPFARQQSPTLAARLDPANGKLNTPGTIENQIKFVQAQTKSEKLENIARESILTFTVSAGSFYIESTPIDGSKADPGRTMKFTPPDNTTEVEIILGNEPADDIYAEPEEMEIDLHAEETAKEFELFYRLCAVAIADPALPIGKNAGGKGGSHQLCANAVLK